jgi:uncharacterized protein (TIGR00369 family)
MTESDESSGTQFAKALAEGDLSAATEFHRRTPLHDLMRLTVVGQGENSITMTMELSDVVRGAAEGSIHGGVLATFAHAVSATALTGAYDEASGIPVTTDLHLRYYRQPRSGPLTAEARVVHRGRRLLSTECAIVDAEHRVLARSTATDMIVSL